MSIKYTVTEETKILQVIKENSISCIKVYRIKALDDFGLVRKGDLGGWVENSNNLSYSGDCWIFDDAAVIGDAFVSENATISGNAVISGSAKIYGRAIVSGNATVHDNAFVSGSAFIFGKADISENAQISGSAKIRDEAKIFGDAEIRGSVIVASNAKIGGKVHIYDNSEFSREAYVMRNKDYLLITVPLVPYKTITFYLDKSLSVMFIYRDIVGKIQNFSETFIPELGKEFTNRVLNQVTRYFNIKEKNCKETVETSRENSNEATVNAPAWIYSDSGFSPEKLNAIREIEKALGFKLFYWQKYYIYYGEYRMFGDTTANILNELLSGDDPLYLSRPYCTSAKIYRDNLLEIYKKLKDAGIPVREVLDYRTL